MVYNVHEKADKATGVIKPDGRGKSCNHHRVSSEDKENVLAYIKSFPLVDSRYYCRPKTNKKYLENGIKVENMYDLYKRNFIENERPFVKSSYYRFIFNTSFNIGFHVPKTDRCERYEEMKIKRKEGVNITNEEQELNDAHIGEKDSMRKEKENDKSTTQENELIIVSDLENVISLPKGEVGSFVYKRKLNIYNLPAITSDKQGYCATWTELTSGRTGNDIASAFTAIMKEIAADGPNKTDFICWSDILEFLQITPSKKSVTFLCARRRKHT